MWGPTLRAFRHDVYSQNGEDGVIEEILRRIGHRGPGVCVEFGAWDGRHLSNTYRLIEAGWSGVMIECDAARFQTLIETKRAHQDRLTAICKEVGYGVDDNLTTILRDTVVPEDFDVLSIDVDSFDWQIWNAFTGYRPKIVVIEVNSSIPPGIRQIHAEEHASGSSFTSTLELAVSKGYRLACHIGNMIFVREDLAARLGLKRWEIDRPERLFDDCYLPRGRMSPRRLAKALGRQLSVLLGRIRLTRA